MLKKLSKEGRFESDLDALIAGKLHAFVPVTVKESSFVGLGVAVANEPGYFPVPLQWCHSDRWSEMEAHAAELNAEAGLNDDAAVGIIASSMAAGKVRP